MTEDIGNGLFLQVTDPGAFAEPQSFREAVDHYLDYLRSSPLSPGTEEFLLPGDPEHRTTQKRLREGIEIDEGTWKQISELL